MYTLLVMCKWLPGGECGLGAIACSLFLQNVAHAHGPLGWLYKAVCKNGGDLSHTDRSRLWATIHQQIEVILGDWRLLP